MEVYMLRDWQSPFIRILYRLYSRVQYGRTGWYRRPRLLTRLKRRAKFENPRWRLNRSKIIERDREKPCFFHFTSSYCFRSRWTTFFLKELTGAKVLDVYLLYIISTIYSLKFNRTRMGKDENGAKLLAWFLCLCIPSVFYQFLSSNVTYIWLFQKLLLFILFFHCYFDQNTVFSSENSRAFYSKKSVFLSKRMPWISACFVCRV
jgi:hypothetical protein